MPPLLFFVPSSGGLWTTDWLNRVIGLKFKTLYNSSNNSWQENYIKNSRLILNSSVPIFDKSHSDVPARFNWFYLHGCSRWPVHGAAVKKSGVLGRLHACSISYPIQNKRSHAVQKSHNFWNWERRATGLRFHAEKGSAQVNLSRRKSDWDHRDLEFGLC